MRSDRDGEHVGGNSSQTDHRTRGSPPIARRLPLPLLPHQRRLDFLWAGHRRLLSARGSLCRSHPCLDGRVAYKIGDDAESDPIEMIVTGVPRAGRDD